MKIAFLYGDLEEDIYMIQLEGVHCLGTRESSPQIEKDHVWPKTNSKIMVQEI